MMSVPSSSSSKKKKKSESSIVKSVATLGLDRGVQNDILAPSDYPIVLSKCYICGGSEDLILVCDSKDGCPNEAHMYCLDPVLTAVPEGDWFCDFCDPLGTTKQLHSYFSEFDKVHSIPTKKSFYNLWVESLQYQYIFVDQLRYSYSSPRFTSDFDTDMDLIGCPVTLLVSKIDEDTKKSHTGRIVSLRVDDDGGRVEHLVHFKR